MRSSILFSIASSLILVSAASAAAAAETAPGPTEAAFDRAFSADELTLIDLLAADFYENALRLSQSRRIQMTTAVYYRELSPGEKASFRHERRDFWRALNETQKRAFRDTSAPLYIELTDEQKRPFRRIILEQLSGPAHQEAAPDEAINNKEI